MLILSLSSRDLTKPFQGNTRLILSSLGALALAGYKVTHLYLTHKILKGSYSVNITDGKKKALIHVIEAYGGEDPRIACLDRYEKLLCFGNKQIEIMKEKSKPISNVIDKLPEKPSVVICERRPVFLTCVKLSKYFKIPLVLRVDALTAFWALERMRHTKNIIPLLKAPFAIASYFLMAKYADYGICVAKRLEEKLNRLGIKNITTIEPTHLMLSETDATIDYFKINKGRPIEIEEDYVVISSKNLEVIKFMSYRTPDLKYVIIGEPFYRSSVETLPKNIEWTGIISDIQLSQLYKKAICTIIYRPWMSGVSMTLLETLRYGRPAIVNSACIDNLNLPNFEGILIVDDISIWPILIKKFQYDEKFRSDLEIKAQRFFRKDFHGKFMSPKC